MSSFGGLNIGLSGLTASKAGLDTAGNNVANASTVGYHRQSVTTEAAGNGGVAAIWSTSVGSGNGVTVVGTARASDQFLQQQSQNAAASNAELSGKAATLSNVESILGEPSDDALQAAMTKLSTSWGDVANASATDATAGASTRTALLSQAATVAGQFNSVSAAISSQWTSSQQQLSAVAQTASSTAAQVAQLNGQIEAGINGGTDVNELEDNRDVLLKSLATQVGGVAQYNADGTVNVSVGGQLLVSGSTSRGLVVGGATAPADPLQSNSVTLSLAPLPGATTSAPITGAGGTAGGLLDAVNVSLPNYSNQLDTVAANLATATNNQQAAGYDQNGNAGGPIFGGTTAASLTVVMTDPKGVAASSIAPTNGVPSSDNTNALNAAQLAQKSGSADNAYAAVVTGLGVASQSMQNQSTTQQTLSTAADSALDSSTGVDIDEESTKLIQYQTAYEASAKYISTVSDTLASLIAMIS